MARRNTEPYIIKLGLNSDPENLEKLSALYMKFKVKWIIEVLSKYPTEIQDEVLKRLNNDIA